MKKAIIYIIIIFSFLISGAGIFIIYYNYFNFNFVEKLFFYSLFGGILGSTVYMGRGFYQSIAEIKIKNRQFNFERWIWWYLTRPILGGVAGILSFLIVYLALDLENSTKNQIVVFLLGFLVGYNFHDFFEKRISKKIDITN